MEKEFECIKIKDGLYLGNKIVAFDLQFLVINKFAYVVNCAAEVPNLFEEHGLRYIKFKIKHDKNQYIFDEELKRLKKIKKVLQEAQQNGLCCLVHCNQDGHRSLTLVIAYLMERFRWRLRKTIEYLQSKGVSIILTDHNIEELTNLQYTLSRQTKLGHLWVGPFVDEEEELITKTFNNTAKKINSKQAKNNSPVKKEINSEVTVEKSNKRVQWQDKIDKEEKKEKKRLFEKAKQEKKEFEKSKEKIQEDHIKKDSKNHLMVAPKAEAGKKSKKKFDVETNPDVRRKAEQGEILKLLKKSGKLKKQLFMDEQQKVELKEKDPSRESIKASKEEQKEEQDKKVYKLTINNYINPNINIIKPPLDKKKKIKPGPKKEKDKFNRTYSEKQAFKKPTFYGKELSRQKESSRDKRNPGHTPVRSRKERKSQKETIV